MPDYVTQRRDGVTRRLRLKGHDYSQPGYYFLTVTTEGNRCLFGVVRDAMFAPHAAGIMIDAEWQAMNGTSPYMSFDAYCVMPNHFHAIVGLGIESQERGANDSIPRIMQIFKSRTTLLYGQGVREQGWPPYSRRLWHTGYHDYIVRTEGELRRVREYIDANPSRWNEDRYFSQQK